MKRLTETTGIALVLSVAALTGAHAAQLNTVPLNGQGKPVSSTPVTTAAGLLRNTTIGSSLNVPKTPVTTAAGLLQNTTIRSSLNVPKTPVTTAAGLSAITYGTFAVPNIKATIATGPITVPKAGTGGGAALAGDSSSAEGFVDTIYKVGVATVGAAGARVVIYLAGAAGATGAAATGVAQGTAGAAGANGIVDTVILSPEALEIMAAGAPLGF
jgi:hypothetical protein